MSEQVAYRPKAAFSDLDALGAVFVNDQTEVNVRELVAASPDGVFVVTEPAVINVLDKYEPLKRAAVPGSAPAPEETPPGGAPAVDIDSLGKEDLLALPDADSIDGAKRMKVDELRDAVRAARQQG
jgi:hypothetical protein